MADTDKVPRPVSDAERFAAKNRVCAIRVLHLQDGADTAHTEVELTTFEGKKVQWMDHTFKSVFELRLSWATIAEPKHGIREAVEAREKYEKSNAAELATYRRLKAKYEQTQEPTP